jgi:hypothetical protein
MGQFNYIRKNPLIILRKRAVVVYMNVYQQYREIYHKYLYNSSNNNNNNTDGTITSAREEVKNNIQFVTLVFYFNSKYP